jgi:transcriptional regulator with XRE-family HTH domain
MDRPPASDSMLKTALPQTLCRLRGQRSMSQRKLARLSGVATSTIAAIETGQAKDVMLSTLLKLCGVLLVTCDYLLGIYADETFASETPAVESRTARESSHNCEHCGQRLRPGEPHMLGECIMIADERGGSTVEHRKYLAARFGFGVASIDAICADEYSRRRLTAGS